MSYNDTWKDGEYGYCYSLVASQGDDNVGRDPKTVASYLRLQASAAFRDSEYELSARLGAAATAINCDARNSHAPDWHRARIILDGRRPLDMQGGDFASRVAQGHRHG